MARKYQAVNKNGDIGERRIKGGKNLKENYVKVGRLRGRNVYAKVGSGFEKEGRTRINTPKKGRFKIFDYVPSAGAGGGGARAQKPKEERGDLVEVTGLVSVSYEGKRKGGFHAEMLFTWHGARNFNAEKLLESATGVLIDVLPEIERIPYELASAVGPDFDRRGVERVVDYSGSDYDSMEFQVFIPRAGGRVLTTGNARVSL